MTLMSMLVALLLSPFLPAEGPSPASRQPVSLAPDTGDTGVADDTGDTGTLDTGHESGSADTASDSGDTASSDTAETGNADTDGDSGDTGPADTGDTSDSGSSEGDSADTGDTGEGETYSSAELAEETGGCGCSGGPLEASWLLVGLAGVALRRRRSRYPDAIGGEIRTDSGRRRSPEDPFRLVRVPFQ